jgi:hypothetical protein
MSRPQLSDTPYGYIAQGGSQVIKGKTVTTLPGATAQEQALQGMGINLSKQLYGMAPEETARYKGFRGISDPLIQQIMQSGMLEASPYQKQLLQDMANTQYEQTKQALYGNRDYLQQQAAEQGVKRGIPYSDIARSYETNVDRDIINQLGQAMLQTQMNQSQQLLNLGQQRTSNQMNIAGAIDQLAQQAFANQMALQVSPAQQTLFQERLAQPTVQTNQKINTAQGPILGNPAPFSGMVGR